MRKKLCITKTLVYQLLLKQQLYKLSMKEGTTHEYINSFNGIVCKLLNIKIKEEDKVLTLLASSLPSLGHLVTIFMKDIL